MDKVRIGAVSYLNTRPLVIGLEQGLGGERVELSYDVPAATADRMQRGELDIALLPTIELARIPDLEIVPGLGIVTRGAAGSVLLLSRRPLGEIRSVSLDPHSRTSNALAQFLFADAWQGRPEFEVGPLELDDALGGHDAVVRIGDKALFEPRPDGVEVHDLGSAWTEATSLPFVYAVWAARPGVLDREIYQALHDSRRLGKRMLDLIAEDYVWNGARHPDIARRYLTENIAYRLGADEVRAIERFLAACAELGLIEQAPTIRLGMQRWTMCDVTAAAMKSTGKSAVEALKET